MDTEVKAIMQGIASSIEMDLRREYQCNQLEIGGIVSADCIRGFKGSFYYSMIMVLLKYYSGQNRNAIDRFIESIDDIKEMKMDEIKNKRAEKIYDDFQKVYKPEKSDM